MKKIIDEIEAGDSPHVLRKEVVHLLKQATDGCAIEVESIQRGDVFWNKLVGGENRPWVVLSCREGLVAAAAMSSAPSVPRAVAVKCRFHTGYICPTVGIFDEEEVRKYVAHPYTNADHLREVEAHFASLIGIRTLPGGKRNLDIPDQTESRQVRRFKRRTKASEKPSRVPEGVLAMNRPPRPA